MLIVVVAALLSLPTQVVPADWSCDPERYADGQCDCGCTALDEADCEGALFTACDRNNCVEGDVPWAEHNPGCMASVCGDGWRDVDEACDDVEGCNADCSASDVGFICGPRADGCDDSGAEVVDEDDEDVVEDGCNAGVGLPAALVLLGLVRRRRR